MDPEALMGIAFTILVGGIISQIYFGTLIQVLTGFKETMDTPETDKILDNGIKAIETLEIADDIADGINDINDIKKALE